MQGWFNPDGWLDLISQILLILGAMAVAVIPSVYAARNHKDIKEVVYQTKNAHGTNLRDDLDRVLIRLEEVSRCVSGLRTELMDEESHRRDSVRELRSDHERVRDDIHKGIKDIDDRLIDLERRIPPHE